MQKKDFVDIKCSAYDINTLDLAIKMIMKNMDRTDVVVKGPIPLPTRKKRFTVNRSPHVNKNSREHYAIHPYCRLIRIIGSNQRLVNSLHEIDIPAGIGINIKVKSY